MSRELKTEQRKIKIDNKGTKNIKVKILINTWCACINEQVGRKTRISLSL